MYVPGGKRFSSATQKQYEVLARKAVQEFLLQRGIDLLTEAHLQEEAFESHDFACINSLGEQILIEVESREKDLSDLQAMRIGGSMRYESVHFLARKCHTKADFFISHSAPRNGRVNECLFIIESKDVFLCPIHKIACHNSNHTGDDLIVNVPHNLGIRFVKLDGVWVGLHQLGIKDFGRRSRNFQFRPQKGWREIPEVKIKLAEAEERCRKGV
jgi:hypothetical protein